MKEFELKNNPPSYQDVANRDAVNSDSESKEAVNDYVTTKKISFPNYKAIANALCDLETAAELCDEENGEFGLVSSIGTLSLINDKPYTVIVSVHIIGGSAWEDKASICDLPSSPVYFPTKKDEVK